MHSACFFIGYAPNKPICWSVSLARGQSVKHITLNKSIKGGGGEREQNTYNKSFIFSFFLLPSFFLLSWLAICIVFFATVLWDVMQCPPPPPPKNEASFKREGLLNGIQKECCDSSLSNTIIIHQIFVTSGLKS